MAATLGPPKSIIVLTFTTFLNFPLYFAEYDSSYGYPNIIIFFTDNLSLGDLNILGSNSQPTPNIDRLTEEGTTFSRWYSQSSSISSRASILTGLLPPRTGIIRSKFLPFRGIPSLVSTGGLQSKEITIAEVLKGKGYTTAFVGLWDLGIGKNGEYLPINQGFDSWYGVPSPHKSQCFHGYKRRSNWKYSGWNVRLFIILASCCFIIVSRVVYPNSFSYRTAVFCQIIFASILCLASHLIEIVVNFIHTRSCVLYMDNTIIEQPYDVENITLHFTRKAATFVETSSKIKRPFFLFVSFMKLNQPIFTSRLFTNHCSTQNVFSAAICEMDWSIGRIMKTLKEHDVDDNTLILISSSAGHWTDGSSDNCRPVNSISNSSGGGDIYLKGTSHNDIWEGTIRAPAVIRWKRYLKGKQTVVSMVTGMDVMPTVLELLNYSTDSLESDGKSLLPLLFNTSKQSLHNFVFHYLDIIKPAAISFGPYKAIYTEIKDDGGVQSHDPPLLFNVELDPGETLPLPHSEYENILANISAALEQHMSARKNKWHSQLDSPFIPYYFPCANPPNCFQVNREGDDFTDLFDN